MSNQQHSGLTVGSGSYPAGVFTPPMQTLPSNFAYLLAAAAHNMRASMMIMDPRQVDNPIVFVNQACCDLTGYSEDELLGRNWRILRGPGTDPLAVARIFSAIEQNEAIEIEILNYRKNGEAFWNRLSVAPIYAYGGSAVYYSATQVDVTAERKLAAELQNLKSSARELADALAQRRQELAQANGALQAQVRERERMEATIHRSSKMEAIGQLTGGIVHDFNNLLAGVMSSLELLQRSIASGKLDSLDRHAGVAMNAARSAASLSRRLLTFARPQAVKPMRTDVNRVLAGLDDLLETTLGPSTEIEMSLARGVRPSLCDKGLLENAILNLAINARDAMPGGGLLKITTANASVDEKRRPPDMADLPAGQYTAISVTDTGTGMTPAVAKHAFDAFFTTKPPGQGTGLGLSMVYEFVKESNGHISVCSQPGAGTTFKLYLPRCDDSAPLSGDRGKKEPIVKLPRADRTATVLVVEDEDSLRAVMNESLRECGYTLLEAADGPTALAILQSNACVDLLVTDIGLPGLDGRQLAQAARLIRPSLPVLFVTGQTEDEPDCDDVEQDSNDGLLIKPFSLTMLEQAIEDRLCRG